MKNIVDVMVRKGVLDKNELSRVCSAQDSFEYPHKVAIRSGLIAEETYLQIVGEEFGYPMLDDLPSDIDLEAFPEVAAGFMDEHCVIPLHRDGCEVHIAVNNPFDHLVFENFRQLYPGKSIKAFLAREDRIKGWIRQNVHVQDDLAGDEADSEDEESTESSFVVQEDIDQLRDLASEAPVIKKVNSFLTRAVEMEASDIHIEPYYDRVSVRFRVDGILSDVETFSKSLQHAVTTRVKIMAKLDISERRIPQDGRIKIKIAGRNIDLRVSCLPTMYGESVVMRILDRESISFTLNTLGFPDRELEIFDDLIRQPYGILLVTGPTGSGKTTTLYSALNAIHSPETKIITIEDPVEYELDGINQVQVNTKAGLSFAKGLRSIVRQDPDVILIGEIRDRETADIAIQSALTGHLVFSTLHTNDSSGAITRLIEMGVEDYLLSSSLIGIMAQRLVRILCPQCKEPFVPDQVLMDKYRLPDDLMDGRVVYRHKGCQACNFTGYKGRTAIFELLNVDEDVKEMILKNKSSVSIKNLAMNKGMQLLQSDGWHKVKNGQTSIAEVVRTTGIQ